MNISDLFFPQRLYCSCCGNIIDDSRTYGLCDFCMENFRWNIDGPIELENADFGAAGTGAACGYGDINGPNVKLIYAVEYGLLERSLIFRLKYNGEKGIAPVISEILADKLRQVKELDRKVPGPGSKSDRYNDICEDIYNGENTIIIPVPMHKRKERKRGFNQTILIGKYLSGMTGIEMLPGALIRTRETPSMRGLSQEERRYAMAGSMELNPAYRDEVVGKKIILLDDFFTTGSSAGECIRVLQEAGPGDITVLTYARRTPMEAAADMEEMNDIA